MKKLDKLLECKIAKIVIIAIIIFVEYFLLQYSCIPSVSRFFRQRIWILFNVLVLLMLNIFLCCIIRSWKVTVTVSVVVSFLFSLVNHFVVQYHESPILYSEFANLKTALNVASGYTYGVDAAVVRLLLAFIVSLFLLFLVWKMKEKFTLTKWVTHLGILVGCIAFVSILLYGNHPIKERYTTFWTWVEPVEKYGYIAYFMENIDCTIHRFKTPEGYSDGKIKDIVGDSTSDIVKEERQYPNVIFILNETFFDLNVYTDIETSEDPFKSFYGIEDAVYGYAVVPTVAHGTNNSEYELLTSNSMYLLFNEAPFNYLDMSTTKGNVPQYFNSLGYQTWAMHCCPASNYSRNTGYKELGFQQLILGEENFENQSYNGNRRWLDADNYKDMIRVLEENSDKPSFVYLLTYQNHGGYEQNESYFDTIQVDSEHGEYTEHIEEFLSSVSISSQAIKELTDYFKNVDQPTIICMVGDHAPSFTKDLEQKAGMTTQEQEIAKRSVPYMIWANYKLDTAKVDFYEYVNLTDLSAVVLAMADFPLTVYQKEILELREEIPVRTANGILMSKEGIIEEFSENSMYYEMVNEYYFLEFCNLTGKNY